MLSRGDNFGLRAEVWEGRGRGKGRRRGGGEVGGGGGEE